MIYKTMINGLPVQAYYSEESIQNIFLPLLRHLTKMQKEKNGRILAMLAAPPGAGKSTLLSFLKYLSETTEGITPIATIGMDGFHRYQKYLDTHTMMRDGTEYLMKEFKGAPETFDLELLEARIKQVAKGEICGWPEYDRMNHDPIENALLVKEDIVLLEGNYLLLNWEGWTNLSDYADYTIKIIAEESLLKDRLVARKHGSGHPLEESIAFVERSDLYNARTCLADSKNADLILELMDDDSYRIEK